MPADSAPPLSVIICTHNPRTDYLTRTLASLRAQTLPLDQWELILVDNASREPVAGRFELSWHPRAKVQPEPTAGLTVARLTGITTAAAPLLVFVDDDNLLAPDYLAQVVVLAAAWPKLGVFGCGSYTPEWEETPATAVAPLLGYLAVHRAPADRWSNQPGDWAAVPAGAGMCVRRDVADRYADLVRNDPRRRWLGRTEGQLAGCEDFDLAYTATDLGYGTGVFVRLAMTHFMPAGRVQASYLLRLAEGHAYSMVILQSMRASSSTRPNRGLLARVRDYRYRRTLGPVERQLHDARRGGERRAWDRLAQAGDSTP